MGVISGSLGITGSIPLTIEMQLTGSTVTIPITGSFRIYNANIQESGSLINITGGSSTQIIATSGTTKIYIYTAGYSSNYMGSHYFYFGTTTTPTTKRFLNSLGSGSFQQSFSHPRISAAGDGLYLYSLVSETSISIDIGYVQ